MATANDSTAADSRPPQDEEGRSSITDELGLLQSQLEGELFFDEAMRRIYATDASAYQELPLAVCLPATESDLVRLIDFANQHHVGLIPRAAGTSLAGQVVGSGIVVDISKCFTKILEIDKEELWVRVQPGVIRNELNMALQPHGLLFGPETSTQNRAMIGGMVGNNSCGSNSVKYGSVRDHLLEVTALLSDGSKVVFRPLSAREFDEKCEPTLSTDSLETTLYRSAREMLGPQEVRQRIADEFPKPSIPRRNTGYALDLLMDCDAFTADNEKPFHFGNLIAGSEGTLCLITEVKLNCLPLPPPVAGLQVAHFDTVDEALRATRLIVEFDCYACELIDRFVLDCTKRSPAHRENRFFLVGDPGAILVTEIRGDSEADVRAVTDQIEARLRDAELGSAFPVLFGDDTRKIWDLRKAGLGLMSNMPGDEKPASVIEDTAVDVQDLPDYIGEFNQQLKTRFDLECVQYAHAGSGEIHLRPVLNLKTEEGVRLFREVAQCIADLVKKYRGSLSGEHGDGRLRGEFLRQMIGEENYQLVREVKRVWDPNNIFNPQKIVDTPAMNQQLRYEPGQSLPIVETVFDWSSTQGVLGAAEMCTGSADCRKTQLTGGVMCPSYMATRNESDTTRARANMLRQILTSRSDDPNPFDDEGLKDVLDLCLSCKGCKRECPSSVDMAQLKAEFQQHYYDANGVPRRARLIAEFAKNQRIAAKAPWLWNTLVSWPITRRWISWFAGFHPARSLPRVASPTVERWLANREETNRPPAAHRHQAEHSPRGEVVLFVDEFTNYNDPHVGRAAVELLEGLGYSVTPFVGESGRSWLSKGLVRDAKRILESNLRHLKGLMKTDIPLVGIEPSAVLTFRDEMQVLVDPSLRSQAADVGARCWMLEEFLSQEADAGRVLAESFVDDHQELLLHRHCFQKALGDQGAVAKALTIPANYTVTEIPSGCCGMAGSFGYEREHYELSMQIGELVLFPAVREAQDKMLVAPGTSCRHQIADGTGKQARHPAEILRDALRPVSQQTNGDP